VFALIQDALKAAVLEVQEYVLLLKVVFRAILTPPYYRRDIIQQLDTIGIGSLTVVSLAGFFTGAALALQTGQSLDQFGARTLVGRLVSASMIRELGPVLTALMFAGRVGSGIAAELGSMVVTDQVNALRALGTDPLRKLVVPRVIATTLMAPVLTVIADTFAIVAGWLISVTKLGVGSGTYWNAVIEGLFMGDVWQGLIKPVVLGFVIGTVGCHVGLRTAGGTQGVGRATTNSVVVASVLVIAADFFLTPLLMEVLY
jgi:phospholipid/cholesterol/gamma-HCH transport system permease protein